ncbi:MAG: lipoprotein-releasing ABC transporter permease subunit [Candidatus Omnitrophota bacterium]
MWPLFISLKYFLSKKREGMISFVGLVSVLGVALGVAALIVVMSIMNGFDSEVKKKIIGTYSHIIIVKEDGISEPEEILARISSRKEIKSSVPFIANQAILKKKGSITGVLVKGIDPDRESEVTDVIKYMGTGREKLDENSIVLGIELMRSENISFGDMVDIVVPYSEFNVEQVKLKVIGSFTSGRYDYDSNIVVVNIKTAQKIFRMGEAVSGIGLKVYDEMQVPGIKEKLQEVFRYPYIVKSWMDLDKNLVAALALEKKMMFIILALIIMVACFNIAGTLIMMVMEKTKDIGILKAIGASSFGINLVFLTEGVMIGFFGVVLGFFSGLFVSNNINAIAGFIEKITGTTLFPSDVYYFTEIPSKVDMPDIFSVVTVGIALTVISGIYPAWKASRKDPVEAIRYE